MPIDTAAIATVEARKTALDLSQELVRVNKAKVDVGTLPPYGWHVYPAGQAAAATLASSETSVVTYLVRSHGTASSLRRF